MRRVLAVTEAMVYLRTEYWLRRWLMGALVTGIAWSRSRLEKTALKASFQLFSVRGASKELRRPRVRRGSSYLLWKECRCSGIQGTTAAALDNGAEAPHSDVTLESRLLQCGEGRLLGEDAPEPSCLNTSGLDNAAIIGQRQESSDGEMDDYQCWTNRWIPHIYRVSSLDRKSVQQQYKN